MVTFKELHGLAVEERKMLSGRIERAKNYSAALDALQIPPNGDDFNAVMGMLDGAAYAAPHLEGR